MIVGIIGKIGHGKDTVSNYIRRNSDTLFTEKRFADPIKACVAQILGCTVLDLEDRNFKERPLGSEWNSYKLFCDDIEQDIRPRNYEEAVYFAETLYGFDESQVKIEEVVMTPRTMLQTMGTEWGRNTIHPDIWVNSMMQEYDSTHLSRSNTKNPTWLMPDVRFPNEAQAIKDRYAFLSKSYDQDQLRASTYLN